MNLNPSYFDADEEELIMKYLCQHSRQFYPPHVIAGFPDFNSCHIQDHTVHYLIRIHYFYDEKGYLLII